MSPSFNEAWNWFEPYKGCGAFYLNPIVQNIEKMIGEDLILPLIYQGSTRVGPQPLKATLTHK